jgi:L-amino acid N-acyltransferase YncA
VLGVEFWHAINAALIEVLSRSKARADKYKTVLNTTQFREDKPTLVVHRDVFLECGFKQVGLLKEIGEKNGVLMDRAILQRLV